MPASILGGLLKIVLTSSAGEFELHKIHIDMNIYIYICIQSPFKLVLGGLVSGGRDQLFGAGQGRYLGTWTLNLGLSHLLRSFGLQSNRRQRQR